MPLAIFDLDGTLVDQARAAQEWARGFAAAWSLDADACAAVAAALAESRPKGEVFEEITRRFAIPAPALWADYRAQMPGLVRCTDADRAALTELRSAGWALGIATNGSADNQVGKIRSTGLAGLVDGWAVSSEVGARKPDPAIFRALAERIGCPLEGWMIGDSLELDVAGGAGVGLRSAWITAEPTVESSATITAQTVAQAVGLILAREHADAMR